MDISVNPETFRFALTQITDGWIFENFAHDYLSKILSYDFVPAGGIRDRGIDGLEHTLWRSNRERIIYQVSIDQQPKSKIEDTLTKLKLNNISYESLVYVTNRVVPSQDRLVDELEEKFDKVVRIWDQGWLAAHVNDSEKTVRSYQIFIDSHLHAFAKPGATYLVANMESDPRVYAFLRQQWEEHHRSTPLNAILADTLILYVLEGTDPDKGIFLSRDEIFSAITDLAKIDLRTLHPTISQRLRTLAAKPRKINHHRKIDSFCLRYEERLAIAERNLRDQQLYDEFQADTGASLQTYLSPGLLPVVDATHLVEDILNALFSRQGLEFSDFIINGVAATTFEKSLPELVAEVVNKRAITNKDHELLKQQLLLTIRNMIYNGSEAQRTFLNRLSHTYMLMFLMQCDPQLATYFESLSGKLTVYTDASIIIPAMSEYFLEPRNRRYSTLLRGAGDRGVRLVINEAILNELVSHFYMINEIYRKEYEGADDFYEDEYSIALVDQIMLRAYFYALRRGTVSDWRTFISAFVSPNMRNLQGNLIEWLNTEFRIRYVPNSAENIELNPSEVAAVAGKLAGFKTDETDAGRQKKAKNDAEVILSVYRVRELRNELGLGSIFGYTTWWLTSDSTTYRAVKEVFPEKYASDCYMRPDFLYNFVSLAPSKTETDEAFAALFPTVVGVNLSFRVPDVIVKSIHGFIRDYRSMNPGRVKATLKELIDNLKSDPSYWTPNKVTSFLDERRKEILAADRTTH